MPAVSKYESIANRNRSGSESSGVKRNSFPRKNPLTRSNFHAVTGIRNEILPQKISVSNPYHPIYRACLSFLRLAVNVKEHRYTHSSCLDCVGGVYLWGRLFRASKINLCCSINLDPCVRSFPATRSITTYGNSCWSWMANLDKNKVDTILHPCLCSPWPCPMVSWLTRR